MNEIPGEKVLFPQKFTFKMDVELKSRKANTLGVHQGVALGLYWVHTSPKKKRRGWEALDIDPCQLRHGSKAKIQKIPANSYSGVSPLNGDAVLVQLSLSQ